MIVVFEKAYLQELYETGRVDGKKYRFQRGVIINYQRCIKILLGASGVEALYRMHSLSYEVLKGNKQGISSIRVNKQYRIEFRIDKSNGESLVSICNILDLSNHYK